MIALFVRIRPMRRILSLVFALTLTGCAGGGKITTQVDEVSGRRVDRMSENRIGHVPCELTRDPCVFLEAERIVIGRTRPRYRLVATYEGDEWLFIQGGRTLEFEMRDTAQSFSLFGQGSKEHRKILGDKKLQETAYYQISPNNLQRLADSEKIRMKLHGDGFYVERNFTSGNRKNLKAFAQKFIGK